MPRYISRPRRLAAAVVSGGGISGRPAPRIQQRVSTCSVMPVECYIGYLRDAHQRAREDDRCLQENVRSTRGCHRVLRGWDLVRPQRNESARNAMYRGKIGKVGGWCRSSCRGSSGRSDQPETRCFAFPLLAVVHTSILGQNITGTYGVTRADIW